MSQRKKETRKAAKCTEDKVMQGEKRKKSGRVLISENKGYSGEERGSIAQGFKRKRCRIGACLLKYSKNVKYNSVPYADSTPSPMYFQSKCTECI
jgi:hypothetical protein